MLEWNKGALQVVFDRETNLALHGAKITSDAGSPVYPKLEDYMASQGLCTFSKWKISEKATFVTRFSIGHRVSRFKE